eukprot:TRINITY_DN2583_c0_g5_i2.p1 TRINITY_DN2583_c0_g5~~TRINITY_DN2583_c0_g5_i2.p1  ORF type:complete len:1030 (+),score=226.16 TRINITY_DN2583_c0_g5_i2:154-3243(+)
MGCCCTTPAEPKGSPASGDGADRCSGAHESAAKRGSEADGSQDERPAFAPLTAAAAGSRRLSRAGCHFSGSNDDRPPRPPHLAPGGSTPPRPPGWGAWLAESQFEAKFRFDHEIKPGLWAVIDGEGHHLACQVTHRRDPGWERSVRVALLARTPLKHPNVLGFKFHYSTAEYNVFVTDVLNKVSFKEEYPEKVAIKIIRDVVNGVVYLHSRSIVHGDLRPSSVLIKGSSTVKLQKTATSASDAELSPPRTASTPQLKAVGSWSSCGTYKKSACTPVPSSLESLRGVDIARLLEDLEEGGEGEEDANRPIPMGNVVLSNFGMSVANPKLFLPSSPPAGSPPRSPNAQQLFFSPKVLASISCGNLHPDPRQKSPRGIYRHDPVSCIDPLAMDTPGALISPFDRSPAGLSDGRKTITPTPLSPNSAASPAPNSPPATGTPPDMPVDDAALIAGLRTPTPTAPEATKTDKAEKVSSRSSSPSQYCCLAPPAPATMPPKQSACHGMMVSLATLGPGAAAHLPPVDKVSAHPPSPRCRSPVGSSSPTTGWRPPQIGAAPPLSLSTTTAMPRLHVDPAADPRVDLGDVHPRSPRAHVSSPPQRRVRSHYGGSLSGSSPSPPPDGVMPQGRTRSHTSPPQYIDLPTYDACSLTAAHQAPELVMHILSRLALFPQEHREQLRGVDLNALKATMPQHVPQHDVHHPYGARSDIWSIGVLGCLLLTGKHPFRKAGDIPGTVAAICHAEVDYEGDEWKNVSDDAKAFVRACLEMNPSHRPTAECLVSHRWLHSDKKHSIEPLGATTREDPSNADSAASGDVEIVWDSRVLFTSKEVLMTIESSLDPRDPRAKTLSALERLTDDLHEIHPECEWCIYMDRPGECAAIIESSDYINDLEAYQSHHAKFVMGTMDFLLLGAPGGKDKHHTPTELESTEADGIIVHSNYVPACVVDDLFSAILEARRLETEWMHEFLVQHFPHHCWVVVHGSAHAKSSLTSDRSPFLKVIYKKHSLHCFGYDGAFLRKPLTQHPKHPLMTVGLRA